VVAWFGESDLSVVTPLWASYPMYDLVPSDSVLPGGSSCVEWELVKHIDALQPHLTK